MDITPTRPDTLELERRYIVLRYSRCSGKHALMDAMVPELLAAGVTSIMWRDGYDNHLIPIVRKPTS